MKKLYGALLVNKIVANYYIEKKVCNFHENTSEHLS